MQITESLLSSYCTDSSVNFGQHTRRCVKREILKETALKESFLTLTLSSRNKKCLMNLLTTALHIFMALNRPSSAFIDIISFDPNNQQGDKPYYHLCQLLPFSLNIFSMDKPVFLQWKRAHQTWTSLWISFSISVAAQSTFPDIPSWLCSIIPFNSSCNFNSSQ